LFRWVQRSTPLLIEEARPSRHTVGGRWFVDETYVKVAGVWRYVFQAVDQHGQVIDVDVSTRRDIASARTFFTAALTAPGEPSTPPSGTRATGSVRPRTAQSQAAPDARVDDQPDRA